jgi:hypothetical protein
MAQIEMPPPPLPPVSPRVLDRPDDEAARSPRASWRWRVGAQGEALGGFAPQWALGGGAFVELGRSSDVPVKPAIRASLLAASIDPAFSGPVRARLAWFIARVEGCETAGTRRVHLSLSACLGADAGVLRSEGLGASLSAPNTSNSAWASLDLLGRLVLEPAPRWQIEGGGGAIVPLERYTFDYERTGMAPADVGQFPVVGAELEVGVGYIFP